ncbi:FHA domain-containing protein [Nostoc flagelliforme FACHB-838]|uniref:FHA domain-containing protein n=1 Tax=Nostoc flagelliforme FACHB-838 TaxID=2692904 RepID=A0ABR8DH78_9NOSO|nr:FHA domain-containing protein [Nostoc flagelliforme]MBD2528892.1 FHA domain-containing protein [Nostoc flagelliforme FACHB-838]
MKVKVSYSPNLSEVNEVDLTIETPRRGEWLIGRSPDSDLLLDSPDISRVHAKFFVKGGNYYFCDLGSRNGSIFNGKQAEKDRPYSLSDGDVIRIADYVLILEAVAPVYEQPETVFRIIDPSLFSRPRSPENISTANVATPAPQVVNQVPQPVSQEVETPEINVPSLETSEVLEVVSTQSNDVIPVVEIIAPENITESPEAVSEVLHNVRDEIVDLHTLVVPEVSADGEEVEVPEVNEASEVSLSEPNESIAVPENIIKTPEEESVIPQAADDKVADLEAALAAESTFVQRRDTSAIPEATYDENAELEAALEAEVTFVQPRDIFGEVPAQIAIPEATDAEDAEFEAALAAEVTFVQPRDIFHQVSEEESAVPEATHDKTVDLDTPVVEGISTDVEELVNEVPEYADIQPQETSSQLLEASQVTHDVSDEAIDLNTPITAEDTTDVNEVEPSSTADKTVNDVPEASTAPDDNFPEVFSNQYIDLTNTNTEEISLDVDDVSTQESEVSELVDIQSWKIIESGSSESISQTIEDVSEVEVTQPDETPEDINVSEPPQMVIERNIVLIAHESKKSELAELVSQHQEFFSQSFTITWPSISEVLHQQAGITISQQTPAPTSGGYQTIASLVGAGEILAVIFLRDLLQPQTGQANEEALLRLCTINQVLLATNLPTAEAIVHYLKQI